MFAEKKDKILELETRKKIYEFVRKYSGCHFRELERKSGLAHGTLTYHLHFLVKHNLLTYKKENNTSRYFPAEIKENTALLGVLRQTALRKIILFLLAEESYHEEIVRFLRLSPSTVSWHLKKLTNEGIISTTKLGRKTKYKLAIDKEEIIKLLITYKESFLDARVNRTIEAWELR